MITILTSTKYSSFCSFEICSSFKRTACAAFGTIVLRLCTGLTAYPANRLPELNINYGKF